MPRLVYAKAVTYLTAQGKAHHLNVTCVPYSPVGLTAEYACTFGDDYMLRINAAGKCGLTAALYVGPKFTTYRGTEKTQVALCRAGWQKDLPTPWS